jgi:thiamine biosynthesis lipoprotein
MSIIEIVEQRWRTTLAVTLPGSADPAAVRTAAQILTEEVTRLEQAASRFRADSEISGVNRACGTWVPASSLLIELVEVALAAADSTGGLVDPCLGRQVDAAGYRSWAAGDVAVLDVRVPVPASVGSWRDVEVSAGRVRIPEGVALDLGATAKAWLADEVAERIAEDLGIDVIANMGGDLRVIAASPGWVVSADHEVPGLAERTIGITDGGLATSGQGRRRWLTTAGPAHHLIDPRTGRCADTGWWAVSALAATATAANVASTAGMLLDGEAPAWFAERGLHGLFTRWSGSGRAAAHTVGPWPEIGEAA